MNRIPLVMVALSILVAFGILPDAHATPQALGSVTMASSEVAKIKRTIDRDTKELKEFRKLIKNLESTARESSSARRQKIITDLHNAMGREIVQLEKKIGEEYFLRTHGEVQKRRDGRTERPTGSAAVFTPAHQRLTHMQGIYRVCSRGQRKAVNKEGSGLTDYLEKVNTFALLMEGDLQATRALLPAETAEKSKASMW
ncbi:MAG: hypothetical protein JSW50_15240 [Candidatus Latescibacterota bacterium]|nr:MAG: hypothetical protein JSW50_15240 [Candidatus Latescibacterota bacterium]